MSNYDIAYLEQKMRDYLNQQYKKAGDKLSKRDQINMKLHLDIDATSFDEFVDALIDKGILEIDQDRGDFLVIK